MIYTLNIFGKILWQILYRSSNSLSTIILSQLLTIIQEEIHQKNMLKRIIPIAMAFLFVWLTIRYISVVTIFSAAERNIMSSGYGRHFFLPFADQCSTSSYSRVSYINDGDSTRNAGPLSYKSETLKKIYKNRTSTKRINNHVLNHYHLHQMRIRNKDKHAFFTIFTCIHIHLDAWIKDLDKFILF